LVQEPVVECSWNKRLHRARSTSKEKEMEMKTLLCAAAAIALIAPQTASAQPQDRHQQNAQHNPRASAQRQRATPQRAQRQRAAPQRMQRQRPVTERTRTKTTRVTRPNGQTRTTRVTRTTNPRALPTYRPGHRPSTYHRIHTTTVFRYPRGYHYRRWGIGLILPRIFLSNYYYWPNWAALGLGPPPPGYVWVRYGPDLLLVNRYTGRIADVIYGAFY
jgi:Ni/Co efflux regulator RcnB